MNNSIATSLLPHGKKVQESVYRDARAAVFVSKSDGRQPASLETPTLWSRGWKNSFWSWFWSENRLWLKVWNKSKWWRQ